MNHQFNIEIAKKYGIEEAILIENIAFWIKRNIANEKNFYDGKYWIYNSAKAFSELFPYMNEKKIYRVLKRLEDLGILATGNYNNSPYDRTKWYTIVDKYIFQLYELHLPKMENGKSENDQPIPDNKPDIKPYNKPDIYIEQKKEKVELEFEKLWKLYPNKKGKANAFNAYKRYRKNKDKQEFFELVKHGILCYAKEVSDKEARYIKHGSTFFNQQSWLDYEGIDINDVKVKTDVTGRVNSLEEKPEYLKFYE